MLIDPYPLARPWLMVMEPEVAHALSIRGLKTGLVRNPSKYDDPILATDVLGIRFANPIGSAAGFDKDGEVPNAVFGLGFGFAEVGTVTPRPQAGNPKPRIFRLPTERGVINRLGFNSGGMAAVARNLRRKKATRPIGINVGANRDSADRIADYVVCIQELGPHADYLAVNISSPNTPGLRALQSRDALQELIARVLAARDGLERRPPLLVKVAPDLTERDVTDIADIALTSGLDGLIVGNTTVSRPDGLLGESATEDGGLSGRPLFALSTRILADFFAATGGKIPLIGTGGISSGTDAYAKIRAGASLIQLYTALFYEGPGLVPRMKRELAHLLRRDGFGSVAEAVGTAGR